ncbi:MAG: hypothetical protein EP330_29685 [Deltaproteobacteria bacterium]|nr:MAG: hypothetical protein EP330_29685 [Deltaproteobacteria bacterium]
MIILGVSDGPHAGAALTVDGHLVAVAHQERLDRHTASRAFPWQAVDEVLDNAGVHPSDIDLVGVAGRFSPPLIARRYPALRALTRDPFSPVNDWSVLYAAILRHSGLGAIEADAAGDFLSERLREREIDPQRVILVDVHRALAEAAYRQQDDTTDVLVLTMHPRGDGVAVSAHVGNSAQLDRFWTQKGFASLHVHLARCTAALGLTPDVEDPLLWGMAAQGEASEHLVEIMDEHVDVNGLRLSRQTFLVPSSRRDRTYRALARSSRADAAASVQANLRRTVQKLVRTHIGHWGIGTVALGGSVFDNPRMVAAVAELDEVERVLTGPEPGWGSLAIGAATMLAGRPPRPVRPMGSDLGALADAEIAAAAQVLAKGEAVAFAAGIADTGPEAGGTRAALVRADDASAVERLRSALGRSEYEVPLALVREADLATVRHANKLDLCLRYGTAAPVVPPELTSALSGVTGADGRARMRIASGPLLALLEASGVPALAAFPLGQAQEPCAHTAAQARATATAADLFPLIVGE